MVDEDELEKIKKQRQEELQNQSQETAEEQVEQQKKQIWSQASQYMTSEARSRLGNIKAVDEQKALAVARQIVALGKSRRIEKVDEDEMKQILNSIQNQDQSNIKFRR